MTKQRIILANSSRLLREMLNRILRKTDSLKVVREVSDQKDLPDAIQQDDAEWLIMSLPEDEKMPEWVDVYMMEHPSLHILTVSPDGGRVRLRWLESHEEDLVDPSLDDLILVLEQDPGHAWEVRH
jgi:DNA-binding NarL/FixJ family response regulator